MESLTRRTLPCMHAQLHIPTIEINKGTSACLPERSESRRQLSQSEEADGKNRRRPQIIILSSIGA